MPLVPVDALFNAAAKTVAPGAVQVELRAAVHSKIVLVASGETFCTAPVLHPAQISRFRLRVPLQQQSMVG